jgi:hypothetical protein
MLLRKLRQVNESGGVGGCKRELLAKNRLSDNLGKGSAFTSQEKYIGMDVHQATIAVAVMDAAGKLIMEMPAEAKASTIVEFIQGRPSYMRLPSSADHGPINGGGQHLELHSDKGNIMVRKTAGSA